MPRSFMCVVAKHVSAKKMIFRSSQLVVSLPRSGYCRGIIIISMELLHCTCLVLQLSFCKKICGVVEKFQLFSQAIGICLSDTTINFCFCYFKLAWFYLFLSQSQIVSIKTVLLHHESLFIGFQPRPTLWQHHLRHQITDLNTSTANWMEWSGGKNASMIIEARLVSCNNTVE